MNVLMDGFYRSEVLKPGASIWFETLGVLGSKNLTLFFRAAT